MFVHVVQIINSPEIIVLTLKMQYFCLILLLIPQSHYFITSFASYAAFSPAIRIFFFFTLFPQ